MNYKEQILAKRKLYNIQTERYGRFQDLHRTIQQVSFDSEFYKYILVNYDKFKTYKR